MSNSHICQLDFARRPLHSHYSPRYQGIVAGHGQAKVLAKFQHLAIGCRFTPSNVCYKIKFGEQRADLAQEIRSYDVLAECMNASAVAGLVCKGTESHFQGAIYEGNHVRG